MLELIYCAAGNARFAELAINAGWLYGARLPGTIYYQPHFVDQDYHNPNLEKYLAQVSEVKPYMATVIDYERHIGIETVFDWAESIAPYVEIIIIIPKVQRTIGNIPYEIGGRRVRLGYSIPTSYGGTAVSFQEFGRREIHLLGGSPNRQMRLSKLLNVASADGNYIQKMAVRYCQYWAPGNAKAKNRWFPQLQETDGYQGHDAPYVAFEYSVNNLMKAWRQIEEYSSLPLFSGGAS